MGKKLPEFLAQSHNRDLTLCEIRAINEDDLTIELSFSSDEPYRRWFGDEILSHDPSAVDFRRFEKKAPLLAEHDRDKQIGVIERAWLDGNKGRAIVRFSKNSLLAKEYFADVKDGIRQNVSVGYQVHEADVTGKREDTEIWTVTRWEPYEISIVSAPADISVGVGRNFKKENQIKGEKMDKEQAALEAKKSIDEARAKEVSRMKEISAIGTSFKKGDLAEKAITDGMSVDQFRQEVLNSFKDAPISTESGFIGLSEKEVKDFSLMRALRALANPTDARAQKEAAYEYDVSRAAQEAAGVQSQGILIPFDILSRTITVGGTGGNLVPNDLQTNNFIELLRNRSAVMQHATIMHGLSGNIQIPVQLSASEIKNLGEIEAITDSEIKFGQKNMAARRVGGSIPYSKQLLMQSSLAVEQFIQGDLIKQIALKIDFNALNGDGTGNAPIGIRNATGVNVLPVSGSPKWDDFVELETLVNVENAGVSGMLYLMNAKGGGYVKRTPIVAGHPTFIANNGNINGYPYELSNQVPESIIFGNFSDLVIGFWGGVDLVVDPYSKKKTGEIEVTANQFYDVLVRRAASFSLINDVNYSGGSGAN